MTRKKDSLLKNFVYQKADFGAATYYHINWWGTYLHRAHALTAGLDSFGGLFLIASSYVSNAAAQHTFEGAEIMVTIGDSSFTTNTAAVPQNKRPLRETDAKQNLTLGTWCPVLRIYLNRTENGVIRKIAENHGKRIFFYFHKKGKKISPSHELSKRYKQGIKDCYELSLLLKEGY